MDPQAQIILGAVAILVGGGFSTLLGVMMKGVLKTQEQQGEQQAEWRAIIKEKGNQLQLIVAEKDRQITRLEAIIQLRDERIVTLERRVTEVESRAAKAELRVEILENQVKDHG